MSTPSEHSSISVIKGMVNTHSSTRSSTQESWRKVFGGSARKYNCLFSKIYESTRKRHCCLNDIFGVPVLSVPFPKASSEDKEMLRSLLKYKKFERENK